MMDSTYCLMKELGNLFTEKEKQRPNYIVIAPGRVNLIGEHVDHQGYSVLPIAISQSIVLAIGWSKKTTNNIPILRVINTDQDNQEKEKVFFNVKDITLNREHHWTDYVICGFWGSMLLHDVDQTNIQQILSRTNHLIPFNVLDNIQNVFLKHKNHTLTFYIASSLPSVC
jgi:galactokinase